MEERTGAAGMAARPGGGAERSPRKGAVPRRRRRAGDGVRPPEPPRGGDSVHPPRPPRGGEGGPALPAGRAGRTGAGSYQAKDITVLEGLEPVRRRPAMYIGGVDSRGLHHLIWEILDNS